jgi:DUF1009 family protein
MEEKSDIQIVVDLLEENGFHVCKAKEVPADIDEQAITKGKRAISLRIAPKGQSGKC